VIRKRVFRAMGTDVELLLDSTSDSPSGKALEAAEWEIRRLEGLLSRFRPESELSQLNRAGAILAGPELVEVVELGLAGRESTGGRFDPTVHDAVVAAGYDRSFELIDHDDAGGGGAVARCGGRVHLDRESRAISLEPGIRLDLGGIAKGYSADRVSGLLSVFGPCLVNIGGDLATCGIPEDGAWAVAVEAPEGTLSLSLERGAMATSGRDRRRWCRDGDEAHHVIDPGTARPSETDLLRVTVVASTAAWAEVLATGFMVAGAEAAEREADALGVPCVLVTDEGSTRRAGGL
jgi:thiamine biosynthesis lipoprotein